MARTRAGESARALILVGLLLDLFLEVIAVVIVSIFFLAVPLIGPLALGVVSVGFLWVLLIWAFSYRRVARGDYEGARGPTLAIGILSLLTLSIIPAILFLIAYAKLGTALEDAPFVPASRQRRREEPAGENDGAPRAHWRGWHVIGRFLPMVFLGLLFMLIGALDPALHKGHAFGVLFLWVGVILIVAAVLGMLFTKCPVCYSTHWVVCVQEPDVRRRQYHGHERYVRELSAPEEEG